MWNIEKVDRAAIMVDDTCYSIIRPARHHHIMRMITLIKGNYDWVGDEDQGFMTTLQRFVDRIEGAKIALDTGQLPALHWPPRLYSEDLW